MTSADFSWNIHETSQGKTHVFHTYARRIYVTPFCVRIGLWRYSPPNPNVTPRMRFLCIGPVICLRLPSAYASQRTPCRSASSSPYRANTGLPPARRAPCLAHKKRAITIGYRPYKSCSAVQHYSSSSETVTAAAVAALSTAFLLPPRRVRRREVLPLSASWPTEYCVL